MKITIPLLIVVLTFTSCIFQSDEILKLNNPLDPNSDAYVEAGVSELNIESGQKFYTSDITVTWKGNSQATEYQYILEDSTYAWGSSSSINLTDLVPGEYLFKVTPRNQAGFTGKSLDCLFTVFESPAVDTLSIENGQVFTTPDVEITWTGNTTAASYLCSLNDQPDEWSDATSVSFEGLADSIYTLTITAKNEDIIGVPRTWTFIVDTSTTPRITITGNVTGTDEATVLLEGDASEARITVDDGTYSFNVTDGGTYTLIPQKQGYSFHPISVNLDEITTDITQNFIATLNTHTISGTVTGADSVTVRLSGDIDDEMTVDNGDSYSFTVDALGNYLIIPTKEEYETSPSSALFVYLTQDGTQNFDMIKTVEALTISGLVTGLSGVTVRLSGDLGGTQLVDDGDRYEFIVDEGGIYTVSIFKEECMFNAYEVNFENISASKVQDFNGQLIPEDIKTQFFENAANEDLIRIEVMLEAMPFIHSIKDNNDWTPLHRAAVGNQIETAQLLLDRGADIEAKDYQGWPPLYYSAWYGYTEMVQLLFDRGADIEAKNNDGRTILLGIAGSGKTENLLLLIEMGADIEAKDNEGNTLLHNFVLYGNAETVQLLLDRGADIEAKNNYGGTPLHRANKTETLQLLLDRGADIEAKNNSGWTPLYRAVENGRTEKVQLLLDRGADIEAKDLQGKTPLHSAAMWGQTETLQLLLDRGADIEAKNNGDWTPLHSAAWKGQTETAQLLLDRGADIEAKNNGGGTPLHNTAYRGKIETAQLLLDNGANVNALNKSNETPLDFAENNDHTETAEILITAGGKLGSEL
ncbi:ankyrin repeat domain-containing protein [Candidatus Latescibacterota bacterium]